MGNPDGGWFDETPPRVIAATPSEGATGVEAKKVTILFDEFITIDNATENVIISPPQIEPADIKTKGKSIVVSLKDSLKANTTYTIDFSNAIKDNNENNYMGSYTYSFATGAEIDTMQVSGYVVDAETLEPMVGIQVGVYEEGSGEEAFSSRALERIARTDQNGHFTIKGVKPGSYRVYALQDMDNNFFLTPRSGETMAFKEEIIATAVKDDIRQDTTWLDSLRIRSIERVPYKRFLPDDIMLRAFAPVKTDRMFLKADRDEAQRLRMIYTYGDSILPVLRGLNFDITAENVLLEKSMKGDTLTYWLRDSNLVNRDSLEVELSYRTTDTLGVLQHTTDTLMLVAKLSHEKRLKLAEKEHADWQKQQNKLKKRGEPYDSVMPPKPLKLDMKVNQKHDPDRNITLAFTTPIEHIDTTKIHLYVERDSTWYNARFVLRHKPQADIRTYELMAEWQPGLQYSIEADSAAFTDIYGLATKKVKTALRVGRLDEYGTLLVQMPTMSGKNIIAQLLDQSDKVVKETMTTDGNARFFYIQEKAYYLRIIVDENGNGLWDTGDFDTLRQPEEVYYYNKEIECRAKWDITIEWNPTLLPLNNQKPQRLRKTKNSQQRRNQTGRNLRRAQELGIALPEKIK